MADDSFAGPVASSPTHRMSRGAVLDGVFFVFAGFAAVWLAVLSFQETFDAGWWGVLLFVVFWGLLAYLVLPRLHRILTSVYVPDYFIGRTRTSDGLLGDPVNLALMGSGEEITAAMEAAGWTRADPVTAASSWRIVSSTLRQQSYAEAPVSTLFLFGKQQAFAYQQEVDGNPKQRHHIRFWECPEAWFLPGGRQVDWLAAGTFDTAVGLSFFTLQVTHRIDANTDVERDYVIRTVLDHVSPASLEVIENFSTGYHARNGGGDSIRTDGALPILDLRSHPELAVPQSASTAHRPADTAAKPEKRRAFEGMSTRLQAPDYDPWMPRPTTIVVGAALVLLRALSGALILAGLLNGWDGLTAAVDSAIELLAGTLAETGPIRAVTLVFGVLVLVFQAVLAVLIFVGRDWARVLIMVFALIDITTTFIAWATLQQEITIAGSIFSLALDILILLALSSRNAAAYARGRRAAPPAALSPGFTA